MNACRLVRRLKTHEARVGTLAWNNRTGLLSCGSQSGQIHNYDPRMAHFHVHTLKAHTSGLEVCGLKWSPNGRFLASGSNDNTVNIWDTYTRDPWATPAHSFKEHTAAVKVLEFVAVYMQNSCSLLKICSFCRRWHGVPGNLACWPQEEVLLTSTLGSGMPQQGAWKQM